MSRTPFALLAVVGLVAVAGCGAVLPGGDLGPGGDETDLEPADSPYTTPLENSDLLADHEAALRAAGTFTVVRNTTVTDSGADGGFESLTTARVSLADGRVYETQRPPPVAQYYRYGDGTTFTRYRTGDSYQYSRSANDSDVRSAAEWGREPVAQFLPLASLEHRGATERADGLVHVYRTTDPADVDVDALTGEASAEATLSAVNVTIRVHESGAVTALRLSYTVENGDRERTVETSVTYTAVGETDGSPPAWVDEARDRFGDGDDDAG
ncbi:DUF7537 family lipoprotein [Halobacterium rubrum]|uniref:DUF7537 family lipoprotein n=1 Tax=Halobacterium TaxID=2239 RepID=UPI001F45C1A8|nr:MULTISPECIES: hypothetical protein [Halobacterium]MDH5019695.1 hypothetical protein [Halobacterium rubrum]